MHLVLPCNTPFHEVDVTGTVDRLSEISRLKDPLFTLEDVEVVVGGVKTGMSLGTKRGAENDQVLGDGRVDDIHRTHRTSRVVEHPLRGVGIENDGRRCFLEGYCPQRGGWRELRVFGRKVRHDVVDNSAHVFTVNRNSVLGEAVEARWVKNVPLILQARK